MCQRKKVTQWQENKLRTRCNYFTGAGSRSGASFRVQEITRDGEGGGEQQVPIGGAGF
jgi:hypothetical protein